jgi:hypothetical protein
MAQQECSERHEQLIDGVTLEEFTERQREWLQRLRRQVERGERGEYFPIDKRQDFVRWLIEQGKLSENRN